MWERCFCEAPNATPEDVCISIDYGTMNAFACLLWEKHKDIWIATREYYWSGRDKGIQKTDAEYVEALERWLVDIIGTNPNVRRMMKLEVIVDPSATSFITALHRSGWAKVRQADNAVGDGLRETANALDNGYIKIANHLDNFRDEISGYMWDIKKQEKGIDLPIKERDHLMDSMRYFVKTKNIIKKATRRTMYGC